MVLISAPPRQPAARSPSRGEHHGGHLLGAGGSARLLLFRPMLEGEGYHLLHALGEGGAHDLRLGSGREKLEVLRHRGLDGGERLRAPRHARRRAHAWVSGRPGPREGGREGGAPSAPTLRRRGAREGVRTHVHAAVGALVDDGVEDERRLRDARQLLVAAPASGRVAQRAPRRVHVCPDGLGPARTAGAGRGAC